MDIIKEADFRKQIKASPQKCYLLFGEEEYMKNYAVKYALEALSPDPTLAFFNEIRLDSLSYSPEALINAIMPAPMMADRKLIIIQGLDYSGMKASDLDALGAAIDTLDEYDHNTLIMVASADKFDTGILPKRPSPAYKKLAERAIMVNFEKNSPARLASWIAKHFEHNGVVADQNVCLALIDRSGRDMYTLANETDKLSFYALSHGRNEITIQDIGLVAIAASEYDAFAFTNAIAARKREYALEILYDMKSRRMDPIFIMSKVTETACDMMSVCLLLREGATVAEMSKILSMHEYRIKKMLANNLSEPICKSMIAACCAADMQIKRYSDGYEVLERLICTI